MALETDKKETSYTALILYSFTPSDINFKMITYIGQGDFGKTFVTKNLLTWTILISNMLYRLL